MVDISKVRAIDIHTHAEEPCGYHADDGYDELQSTMARYFGAPCMFTDRLVRLIRSSRLPCAWFRRTASQLQSLKH